MSAISWRELGVRRSPLPAQLSQLFDSLNPWAGLLCAAILFAYPNAAVWPALVLGAMFAAWSVSRADIPPAIAAGLALFVLGLGLGLLASGPTDPALARLTGLCAAVLLCVTLVASLRTETALERTGVALVGLLLVSEVVVLALLRGQLPGSPLARILQPFTQVFQGFSGIAGDTLEVNARFAVHQYGLAHLALAGASFGAALALSGAPTRWRILGALLGIVQLVLLLATQSRGAILALAVAVAVIGSVRSRWSWSVIPLGAIALGLLLLRGTLSRQIEGDWIAQRLSIWGRTLSLLGDFPLTGVGLGARTYAETFAWYFELPNPYAVSHAHNIYLQAYPEQGLFGLIGLVALMAGGSLLAIRIVRQRQASTWAVGAGAAGGFLGSALYGLTDQVVSTNLSLALVLALLAVLIGAWKISAERAHGRAPLLGPTEATPLSSPRRRGEGAEVHRRVRGEVGRRSLAGLGLIVLATVAIGLALGSRWMSGLLLNAGSLELVHALATPGLAGEARRATLERAEGLLNQSAAINGRNIAAWRNLGRARMARNDIPGAHAALDQAAALPRLNEFERYQIGRLYYELGFTEQAVEQWREAGDTVRLRAVAESLASRGKWRETVWAYAALIALEPDNAEAMSNLALGVLNSTGDVDEALGWLESATTRNPAAARSLARQLTLRGEPYRINERRGGGDAQKAAFWFGLASKVDPTYDRPEVELGAVAFYRERYAEAEQHFRQALSRAADSSTYHWVALALERQGRLEEAVSFYKQAVSTRPDRGGLHGSLARAYVNIGRLAEARAAYQEAVRLEPNEPRWQEELQALEVRLGGR